jgi:hypothetical protein
MENFVVVTVAGEPRLRITPVLGYRLPDSLPGVCNQFLVEGVLNDSKTVPLELTLVFPGEQ